VLKKNIILSILGAFIFQAIVFNLFLYTFTLLAKFEEKTGNVQWIEFTEQQYSKLKLNESEFTYNNNMYDVVSSKKGNGTIKLLCKIDEKEKDLLEKLIENFKHSKTKKYITFSFLGEIIPLCDFISYLNNDSKTKHSCFISSIIENSLERTVPPPKA
jgi:hypothetical protein